MYSHISMKRQKSPALKARDERIKKYYNQGLTQRQVAEKESITYQRVQQLERSIGLPPRAEKTPEGGKHEFTCKECGKTARSRQKNRVYCSRACRDEGRRVHKTQAQRKAFAVQRREEARRRSHEYYHNVFKLRKDWKNVVRMRNDKYRLKRIGVSVDLTKV